MQVLRTPGALDNVFRTLQTLPGVNATEEFGSRLAVRGGSPDQNLTIMDGVEIHDPYRLFGLTSAFNPEIIQRFELATGGFSAKYGDRLSSMLLVENRDGIRAERLRRLGRPQHHRRQRRARGRRCRAARPDRGWSPAGAPTTTWSPSGSPTTSSRVSPTCRPRRCGSRPPARTADACSGCAAGSRRRSRSTRTTPAASSRTTPRTTWRGCGRHRRSARACAVAYRGRLFRDALDVRRRRRVREHQPAVERARRRTASASPTWCSSAHSTVRDVSLRAGAGVGARTRTSSRPAPKCTGCPPAASCRSTAIATRRRPTDRARRAAPACPTCWCRRARRPAVARGSQDTWQASAAGGHCRPGCALDYSGLNGETLLSPRLSLAPPASTPAPGCGPPWDATPRAPATRRRRRATTSSTAPATPAAPLRSEQAVQASAGLERSLGRGFELQLDGYVKRFTDVLIGQLETARPSARPGWPATTSRRIWPSSIPTDAAHHDGADQRRPRPRLRLRRVRVAAGRPGRRPAARLGSATPGARPSATPTGAATRSSTTGGTPSRRSRRVQLTRRWELAATTRVASGFPRTAPLGVRRGRRRRRRPIGDGDGVTDEIVPYLDAAGRLVYTVDFGGVGNLNGARLPVFARVDLRATWRPRGAAGRWELYVEVINVLDRQNAGAFEPRLEYDPTSDRPRIVEERDQAIPRLPTLGYASGSEPTPRLSEPVAGMRYLRVLTNSAIAGALMAGYLLITTLHLNPGVPARRRRGRAAGPGARPRLRRQRAGRCSTRSSCFARWPRCRCCPPAG